MPAPAPWKSCESAADTTLIQATARKTLARGRPRLRPRRRAAVARKRHRPAGTARAPRPASAGTTAATLSVSARSPLHSSATSEPAAITAAARSAMLPDSACMPRSSLISRPSKPMPPRMISLVTRARDAGRRVGIDGREHHVRRHRRRQVGQRAERGEIRGLQLVPARAVTTGRSRWLSLVARPCPGMCLMTGSTPPAMSPRATARPSAITCAGSCP